MPDYEVASHTGEKLDAIAARLDEMTLLFGELLGLAVRESDDGTVGAGTEKLLHRIGVNTQPSPETQKWRERQRINRANWMADEDTEQTAEGDETKEVDHADAVAYATGRAAQIGQAGTDSAAESIIDARLDEARGRLRTAAHAAQDDLVVLVDPRPGVEPVQRVNVRAALLAMAAGMEAAADETANVRVGERACWADVAKPLAPQATGHFVPPEPATSAADPLRFWPFDLTGESHHCEFREWIVDRANPHVQRQGSGPTRARMVPGPWRKGVILYTSYSGGDRMPDEVLFTIAPHGEGSNVEIQYSRYGVPDIRRPQ